MSIKVLIPCAGNGSRFGADVPKQYMEISPNKCVLDYTLQSFLAVEEISEILIITSSNDILIDSIVALYNDVRLFVHKVGGDTRAKTVANGLRAMSLAVVDDWILVHDAARCLIKPNLIKHLINELRDDAVGGILALPVNDTVKNVVGGVIQTTLDRQQIYLAQTPQMFRYSVLYNALTNCDLDSITDEASAVESLGFIVRVVCGDPTNIKITHPHDLPLARFFSEFSEYN